MASVSRTASFGVLSLALLASSCIGVGDPAPGTRGIILISIDTLRADHLGCYGYERPTSPFLDSLARRGTLFENAFVQLPGTLPSHMSIFTSLYPAEHGVYPGKVLSPEIPILPEVFSEHGFVTGGFTEGGYVSGHYGFSRGFDAFDDTTARRNDDLETTLARGLEFLKKLQKTDRFFLFLHSYAVHDPYMPPEPYASLYWTDPPPEAFKPIGPNLLAFNRGRLPLSPDGLDYFVALYDGTINYADDALREFHDGVADLGLLEDVTWVITSDHGEEFLEHGSMVHEQIYPETLHVPLLVVQPQGPGGRSVRSLVESVDIAPTLYELAGIPSPLRVSGRSFASTLSQPAQIVKRGAYAEAFVTGDRTLIEMRDEHVFQLLARRPRLHAEGGLWMTRELTFEALLPTVRFRAMSYLTPRVLDVTANGRHRESIRIEEVGSDWTDVTLDLSSVPSPRMVTLSSDGCDSPLELGKSEDPRCLSVRLLDLEGIRVGTTELYDLTLDPGATRDISGTEASMRRDVADRLDSLEWNLVAQPGTKKLPEEIANRLRALGYVQ